MGLCKCIQKKVTNQFCFEHRVNVCEHCMVEEHPQCIIQSYLRWLNDSDYNPVCQLCQDYLVSADCIRLVCYDVFHQSCLNEWAGKLPANTAPAGYICPVCSSGIFPASNLVSPVAVALKEVLSKWEWASAGLGMPIVKNIPENEKHSNYSTSTNFLPRTHSDNFKLDRGIPDGLETSINSSSTVGDSYKGENPFGSSQHRNVSVTNENKVRRDSDASSTVLIPEEEDHPSFDKYKRRPISEWLNQLIRTFRRPSPRHHQGIMGGSRSSAFIISIFVIVILIFIVSYFGGRVEDDPFFDPLNNPNIRVED